MVGYMAEMVLEGRLVLLIGGGQVAVRKVTGLLACAPRITVVAPALHPQLAEMVRDGHCHHLHESFAPALLDVSPPPALVFAVTDEATRNQEIAWHCHQRGLWCNSADNPASSSFLVPAVVRRGPVTLAVSTSGCSPALARLLKERLDGWLEPEWDSLARLFGALRAQVKTAIPEATTRYAFWRKTCLALVQEQRLTAPDNAQWFAARLAQEQRGETTGHNPTKELA